MRLRERSRDLALETEFVGIEVKAGRRPFMQAGAQASACTNYADRFKTTSVVRALRDVVACKAAEA